MSLIRGAARFALYPFARVGEQLSQSRERLGALHEDYKRRREQREAEEAEAIARDMPAELDEAGRFEFFFKRNGWTEQERLERIQIHRRAKLMAIYVFPVPAVIGVAAPLLSTSFIWGAVTFLGCLLACWMFLLHALFNDLNQFVFEERRYLKLPDYRRRFSISHLLT